MVIAQDFYYYMLSLAVLGLWASSYSFLHTGKRKWAHKASSVMLGLFVFVCFVSVLGIGGDLPVGLEGSLVLWVLMFVVGYVGVKAIDRWSVNYERRSQLCKDREFNRRMRKVGGLD